MSPGYRPGRLSAGLYLRRVLSYLPPYSPDLNPIELVFSKMKGYLRKAAERTVDDLWRRIGIILDDFTPAECQNYLRHDGYAPN